MFQNHFQRKPASFHFKLIFMVKTLLLLFLGSDSGIRAQNAADCVAGLYWDGTTTIHTCEGEAKTSTPTDVFEQLCDQKSGVRWMMMELGPKSKSLVLVSAF